MANTESEKCTFHEEAAACFYCAICERPFCEDCLYEVSEDEWLCPECVEEAAEEDEYVDDYCDICLSETAPSNAGNLHCFNGTGTMFYGDREECEYCGSTIRTKWITLFAMPIIPLGSYRVRTISKDWIGWDERFQSRRCALHWPQIFLTWIGVPLAAIAITAAILGGTWLWREFRQADSPPSADSQPTGSPVETPDEN